MERAEVRIDVLKRTEVFRALEQKDLETLAVCFRGWHFQRGEVFFREGDPGGSMIVVAEGTLVATAKKSDGKEETLNAIGAGEVAGEMALLDPAPRSANVRALTDGIAYELTSDTLVVLRARSRAAAAAIVKAAIRDCARRLRRLDERIARELGREGAK